MKPRTFYSELAYLAGIVLLALGTSCASAASFGLSMVVAPAYLIHLKLSPTWPGITFGVAEYIVQAVLLLVLSLALRRFRPYYLFSFCTALLYGRILDGFLALWALVPALTMLPRILVFAVGVLSCALGVSFVLHTYLSPEVYELVVKEVSARYQLPSHRVKTVYDCSSLVVSLIMTAAFFGLSQLRGLGWGTLVCALVTGTCVGWFNRRLEARFQFRPAFPNLEKFFTPNTPSSSTEF